MQTQDAMALINAVEERFPVDTWALGGLRVWPLIRIQLYVRNADHVRSIPPKKSLSRLSSRAVAAMNRARFGYAYLRDYAKNAKPRGNSRIVFLSNGVSCTKLPGGWYDNFCDPFLSILREEGVSSFLMSPSHCYYVPRRSASMFIQPYLARAKSKAKAEYSSRAPEVLEGYKEFQDFVRSFHDSAVAPDFTAIARRASRIDFQSRFFLQILRILKPTLGFQVSYYGQGLAFNEACRKLGIPSVDIQHGIQGEYHFAYARWTKVPSDGYSMLPSIFWCWGRREAEVIKQWSDNTDAWHRPVAGGNLLLQMWTRGDEASVREYDGKILELKRKSGKQTHVLYTYRGNESADMLNTLLAVIRDTADSCHWWIRVHPGMLRELSDVKSRFEKGRLSNVNIHDATSYPLYALLRHIDVHVTGRSTTVIEAQYFGVPSVLTDPEAAQVFSEQVRSQWALPACTSTEIISAIEVQRTQGTTLKTPSEQQMDPSLSRRMLMNLIEDSRRAECGQPSSTAQ